MRAITFPYKTYKNILCPIITLRTGDVEIDAYVDSGAFYSIFSVYEADLIGINYAAGRLGSVIVGDGNYIPVYFHKLPISIGSVSFKATIGFSPKLGVGFNLLGRKDIFDRFKIVLDERRHATTFIPYPL